jgi:hypothetical protein
MHARVKSLIKLYICGCKSGGGRGGCYNLDCPGFVQVNKKVPLGALLSPVSTYGAKQYEIKVQIYTVNSLIHAFLG